MQVTLEPLAERATGTRMDEVVKLRWVNGLRSGKYKQGHNFLLEPDESKHLMRDALGVLCEVLKYDGLVSYRLREWVYDYKGELFYEELPFDLLWEIRLRTADQSFLIGMRGVAFKEAANWIEENL